MCEPKKEPETGRESWTEVSCAPLEVTESILASVGNPMLDLIVYVDDDLLKKYGLRANDVILAHREHAPMYKEIAKHHKVKYVAGGAVLNAVRICQWILKKPFTCTFFGCVGIDQYADILYERARTDGVNARYQRAKSLPTGRCAVLITGAHRAVVADMGAATQLNVDHLRMHGNRKLLEKAKFIYTSAFLLNASPDCVLELAQLAHKLSRVFIFNLGSPDILQASVENLKPLMAYTDVVFGTENEAWTMAGIYGWKRQCKVVAQQIYYLPKKNVNRQRVVIITRTTKPVIVVTEDSLREYPVYEIPPEKIIDSNGTKDAFIGGFLSQYIQGKEMSVCIMWAMWAAGVILRSWGCSFEGKAIINKTWVEGYMKCGDGTATGIYSTPVRNNNTK